MILVEVWCIFFSCPALYDFGAGNGSGLRRGTTGKLWVRLGAISACISFVVSIGS